MSTIKTDALLEQLNWRYATKKFDASRKLDAATWKALEESLILSPSSYGLQPWKFIVVQDPAVRAKLREKAWGQSQTEDASHFVVLARRTDLTEADVARLIERTAQVRGVPAEKLDGYRQMMIGDLIQGPRHAWITEWTARQTYIALGGLMTAAALLGVDTCPMEGLDPAAFDAILGLEGSGYQTVVACAVGYRAADDHYAELPKVRFPAEQVLRTV